MLRDSILQIPAMLHESPALITVVQTALQDAVNTLDLNIKKIAIVWLTAHCTPMQNFVCTGDSTVKGMGAEGNDKANAFFAQVELLLMDNIPRMANPFPAIVAKEIMQCYLEA